MQIGTPYSPFRRAHRRQDQGTDMSRSPIMEAFRRLARDHAETARRGVDLRELRQGLLIPRRRFLQGAGAMAGAAALSGARPAKAAMRPRIVIVGAGIAGLSAALTLRDKGFDATIHEASAHVGGRMHSETAAWLNQQKSEWCGEFIDSGHQTILDLAKRFGLTVVDEVAAEPPGSAD